MMQLFGFQVSWAQSCHMGLCLLGTESTGCGQQDQIHFLESGPIPQQEVLSPTPWSRFLGSCPPESLTGSCHLDPVAIICFRWVTFQKLFLGLCTFLSLHGLCLCFLGHWYFCYINLMIFKNIFYILILYWFICLIDNLFPSPVLLIYFLLCSWWFTVIIDFIYWNSLNNCNHFELWKCPLHIIMITMLKNWSLCLFIPFHLLYCPEYTFSITVNSRSSKSCQPCFLSKKTPFNFN